MEQPLNNAALTGLVLSGGLGKRMSSDGKGVNKALKLFRGRPMIASVIDRLVPQVNDFIINTNDDSISHETLLTMQFATPIQAQFVEDSVKGYAGPLAGLHAALKICKTPWLQMVPCDSPFFPKELVATLLNAAQQSGSLVAVAATPVQTHPVFLLVNVSLLTSLESYLEAGDRKIDRWYRQHAYVEHLFSDENAFANINTEHELKALEQNPLL
jgi:molybdenum cofactor guanylyltransferase